jgi:arsenate reductase
MLAELLGTGLLLVVVVGSGIAAQTLSRDEGLRLLENALVTGAGLGVLVLMFGPISGAHFNPVVSISDWLLGRRHRTGTKGSELFGYVAAQVTGAICGSIFADAMFAKPLVEWSTHARSSAHLLLGEVVATAGLVLLIFGLARTGRTGQTPWAVGAYIAAAYWFTSSTSFANPAVSIARAFTNTFAGIAPRSLPGFVGAELVGAAVGCALIAALYPYPEQVAGQLGVPRSAPPPGPAPFPDPAAPFPDPAAPFPGPAALSKEPA